MTKRNIVKYFQNKKLFISLMRGLIKMESQKLPIYIRSKDRSFDFKSQIMENGMAPKSTQTDADIVRIREILNTDRQLISAN
ncbi:hypothetical protein JCM31826_20160 [Thermaurantimonas aggregans]|uniref:Uncharacterized protein n=1 Tax=Thermaurantimonas aggregans TaxID=2173829 RepID=A0A401XNE1_9FLAO|nr:hypothetical protein JCM31826_20160 [Thermaurantimonas aggregans]